MAKAKKKFDEDFKKIILDLNQSGQSVEELAEQYGIATQTILCLFWKRDKINISLFSDFYNGIVGLFIFRFDSFYQGFFSL